VSGENFLSKGSIMNRDEAISKLMGIKANLRHLLDEKFLRYLKVQSWLSEDKLIMSGEESDYYLDDLPLTMNRDSGPGIKYYPTENSDDSRGMPKEVPRGIDSFGERDTFSFDEADDFQTNRDRNQNSDLSKRFYTNGMDLDELNK
jgi:hypothetical protein